MSSPSPESQAAGGPQKALNPPATEEKTTPNTQGMSTPNTQEQDTANESTDELLVQTSSPEKPAVSMADTIAARAEKRAAKSAETHAKAEELAKAADELLAKEDYQGASISYMEAIYFWSSNPTFYSKLAGVYLKLEYYEDAAHAATRALTLDPKFIDARCQRAIARMEQRLLTAAKVDFDVVLTHSPTHAPTLAFLPRLQSYILASKTLGSHLLSADPVEEQTKDLDFGFPHYDDEKLDIQSVSDSSDCNHVGNGVPCRFYNHEGCSRGDECAFSHAPDEKSVRDELGKNVCIYSLLSSCKFGSSKCVYSHSTAALPKHGWWTSEVETKRVKEVLEMAEKSAKEQRVLEGLLRKMQRKERGRAKAKKERKGKEGEEGEAKEGEAKEGEVKEGTEKADEKNKEKEKEKKPARRPKSASTHKVSGEKKPAASGAPSKGKRKPRGQGKKDGAAKSAPASSAPADGAATVYTYDSTTDSEAEERVMNGGFTDYQLNELAVQGVKPYDDDAHAVLAALSY